MGLDAEQVAALAKAVPAEVVKEAYGDAASGVLKQVGKLGEDVLKTFRLVLFPIQYAAAFQDRLAAYIDRAVRNVPESRLIAPTQSMVLSITDRLRRQEPDSIITALYVNLLSRAMDGERVGEAHPAFVGVISQLAPDEAVLLQELGSTKFTIVPDVFGGSIRADSGTDRPFSRLTGHEVKTGYETQLIRLEKLNQPELLQVFLEHLYHLGLLQFHDDLSSIGIHKGRWGSSFFHVSLSIFGQLFFQACVAQPSEPS